MNIYEKMLAIENEIPVVAKNLNVANRYRAVSEADVIATVKKLEVKYKVFSYPAGREIIESTCDPQKGRFLRVKVTYRFVNTEDPKEFVDMISYGDGVDPSDKAPGKAVTYADKYALMKAYKIITGDDPDQWSPYDAEQEKIAPVKAPQLQEQGWPDDVKAGLEELGIVPARVAVVIKKKESELTADDLRKAIKQKRDFIAARKIKEEKERNAAA